jgi:hypothetical protein
VNTPNPLLTMPRATMLASPVGTHLAIQCQLFPIGRVAMPLKYPHCACHFPSVRMYASVEKYAITAKRKATCIDTTRTKKPEHHYDAGLLLRLCATHH